MIRRDVYLNKLIRKKHNGLIKVITGMRRCGKSYLLNTIFYAHLLSEGVPEDHILRFAFDSATDLERIGEDIEGIYEGKKKADPKKFTAYVRAHTAGDGMYYLLLDEVQYLGCFESVLNGYLRADNMDIYVTGSNAKFLSKDVITEFAGRGDEIRMFPLTFAEFFSVRGGDKNAAFEEYALYGGLPSVVLAGDAESRIAMLNALLSETYISDIVRRHRIRNVGEMDDLLNVLASDIGTLTSPTRLVATFRTRKRSKITPTTVTKYIDYLSDSFLIEYARRYDVRGRSYIETPLKYYFGDIGIRNARIDFRQIELTHTMENIVYNELRFRGYRVDVGLVPVSERDADGVPVRKQLEVDFVCNLGPKRLYIQSAYALPDEEKYGQELRPLKKIDDSFRKIVITRDAVLPHVTEDGIRIMNLFDFLLDPSSLEA